jgi:hypothetical protein
VLTFDEYWNKTFWGRKELSDDACYAEHKKTWQARDADLARERACAEKEVKGTLFDELMDTRATLARERARLNEVRKLAVEQMTHDGNCRWVVLGSNFGPCSRCSVLAILDRKLDVGGSAAGEAEPLSGDPPANSDRSGT